MGRAVCILKREVINTMSIEWLIVKSHFYSVMALTLLSDHFVTEEFLCKNPKPLHILVLACLALYFPFKMALVCEITEVQYLYYC